MSHYIWNKWDKSRPKEGFLPRPPMKPNACNGNWFPPVHFPPPQIRFPPPEPWGCGPFNQFQPGMWPPTEFHEDRALPGNIQGSNKAGAPVFQTVTMRQGNRTEETNSRSEWKDGDYVHSDRKQDRSNDCNNDRNRDRNHDRDHSRDRDRGRVRDWNRETGFAHKRNFNGNGSRNTEPWREERSESWHRWSAKSNAFQGKAKGNYRGRTDNRPNFDKPDVSNNLTKDLDKHRQPQRSGDRFLEKFSSQHTDGFGRVHKRWNWDEDSPGDNESNEINSWLLSSKDKEVHSNKTSEESNNPLPGSEEARSNAIREATDRLKKSLSKKKPTSVNIVDLLSGTETSKNETSVTKSNPYLRDACKNLAEMELDASDMRAIGRANTGSANCLLDEGYTEEGAMTSEVHVVDLSESQVLEMSESPVSRRIAESEETPRKEENRRIANAKKSCSEKVLEKNISVESTNPHRFENAVRVQPEGGSCGPVTNMGSRIASGPSEANMMVSSTSCRAFSPTQLPEGERSPLNTPFHMTDNSPFSPSSALIINKLITKNRLRDIINSRSCKKVEFAMRELVKQHRATLSKEIRRVAESRIPSAPSNILEMPPDESALLADLTIDWQNLPSELISSLGDLFQNFADDDDEPAPATVGSRSVEGIVQLSEKNRCSTTENVEQEVMPEQAQSGFGNPKVQDFQNDTSALHVSSVSGKSIEQAKSLPASDSMVLEGDDTSAAYSVRTVNMSQRDGTHSPKPCLQLPNPVTDGSINFYHEQESVGGTEDCLRTQFAGQVSHMTASRKKQPNIDVVPPPPPPSYSPSDCSTQDDVISPILGCRKQAKGNIRVRPFAREICLPEQPRNTDDRAQSQRCEPEHMGELCDNISVSEHASCTAEKDRGNCDISVLSSAELIEQAVKKKRLEMEQQEKSSWKTLNAKAKKKKSKKKEVQRGGRICIGEKGVSLKQSKRMSSVGIEALASSKEDLQESASRKASRKEKRQTTSANESGPSKPLENESVSAVEQIQPCSVPKSLTDSTTSSTEECAATAVSCTASRVNGLKSGSNGNKAVCGEGFSPLKRATIPCNSVNHSPEQRIEANEITRLFENSAVPRCGGNNARNRVVNNEIECEPVAHTQENRHPVVVVQSEGEDIDITPQSYESDGVSILQLLRMTVPAAAPHPCEMEESDIIKRLLEIDNELQTLVQEKLNLTHALKQKQMQKESQQSKQNSFLEDEECLTGRVHESVTSKETVSNSSGKKKETTVVGKRKVRNNMTRSETPLSLDENLRTENEDEDCVALWSTEKTPVTEVRGTRVCEEGHEKSPVSETTPRKKKLKKCVNVLPQEQSSELRRKSSKKRKVAEMQECFVRVEQLSQSTVQSIMAGEQNDSQSESRARKTSHVNQTKIHNGSILDVKIHKKKLIAGSEDGNVYVYSLKSGKLRKKFTWSDNAGPHSITCMNVVESDESTLIFTGSIDGKFCCFDLETGESMFAPVQVSNSIQCMEYNWKHVFMGTKSGCIVPFSLKNKATREPLTQGGFCVLAIQSTTEGPRRVLVVASRRQPITIRDATSGLYLRTLNSNFSATVYSLLLESSLVYCGTITNNISVFDFQSGALTIEFKAGTGVVCMKMYKGLLFAACYDSKIYIFDVQGKQFVTSIPFPGTMILSVAVTESKIIAACKGALVELDYPDEVRSVLEHRSR